MPSTGKRTSGRGTKRVGPADIAITYDPRPMITVNLLGRDLSALLDSGSVCSFINRAAGELCLAHQYQPQGTDLPVRLADGSETSVLD